MANAVFNNNQTAIVDVHITPNVCTAMHDWLANHEPYDSDATAHSHLLAELRFGKLVTEGGTPKYYAVRLLTTEAVYLSRCTKQAVHEWQLEVRKTGSGQRRTSSTQRLRALIRYTEQLSTLLDRAANA